MSCDYAAGEDQAGGSQEDEFATESMHRPVRFYSVRKESRKDDKVGKAPPCRKQTPSSR